MATTKSQTFSRPPMERMMRFHDPVKEQAYLEAWTVEQIIGLI